MGSRNSNREVVEPPSVPISEIFPYNLIERVTATCMLKERFLGDVQVLC